MANSEQCLMERLNPYDIYRILHKLPFNTNFYEMRGFYCYC